MEAESEMTVKSFLFSLSSKEHKVRIAPATITIKFYMKSTDINLILKIHFK